jgi:hypothetical protein
MLNARQFMSHDLKFRCRILSVSNVPATLCDNGRKTFTDQDAPVGSRSISLVGLLFLRVCEGPVHLENNGFKGTAKIRRDSIRQWPLWKNGSGQKILDPAKR